MHCDPNDQFHRTARPATLGDADEISRILTSAFFDDPVWGPAFPNRDTRPRVAHAYWSFMVGEALSFSESRVLPGAPDPQDPAVGTGIGHPLRAVSIWYPPGADEISLEAYPTYEALLSELLDAEAVDAMSRAGEQFAAARPSEPHAYLTLLGVAPEARGGGHGIALLRAALAQYDTAGVPTYLESSNPVNNTRYEKLGYRPHLGVELADGTPVQTYWREPASAEAI